MGAVPLLSVCLVQDLCKSHTLKHSERLFCFTSTITISAHQSILEIQTKQN